MTPDSTLCADACQETLSQAVSMPWQSSRRSPSSTRPRPTMATPRIPDAAEAALAWHEPPEPDREAEHEEAREVGGELVVEPGARGGQRPEVADVVVERAERLGLRDVAEHDPESERHRGRARRRWSGRSPARDGVSTNRGSARAMRARVGGSAAESVRIAGARRRLLYPRPRCAPRSSPSRRDARRRRRRARLPRPRRASSGRASRTSPASSSRRAGRSRSTSSAGRGRAGRRRSSPCSRTSTITGRETLTAMQRRLATTATAAGVNGDYFTFATGRRAASCSATASSRRRRAATARARASRPTERSTCAGSRSSARGAGSPRPARARASTLRRPRTAPRSTRGVGSATPAIPGASAVVLFPFPAAAPNVDLVAPVVEERVDGGSVAIPLGGAVLVARGLAAPRSTLGGARSARRRRCGSPPARLARHRSPRSAAGRRSSGTATPVFRAGEAFTHAQLAPRAPRSAVGQLADGRIVLVAVDGRQPGYSVGMTNFELAQTLVRLGAVTGMALDSGGSTTMAFDGALLNRPVRRARALDLDRRSCSSTRASSRPTRRPSSRRTVTGSRRRPACATARPAVDGDVTLRGAGGHAARDDDRRASSRARTRVAVPAGRPRRPPPAPGRWTLRRSSAVDEIGAGVARCRGRSCSTTRSASSGAAARGSSRRRAGSSPITWRLARERARVTVTILDARGALVRDARSAARPR